MLTPYPWNNVHVNPLPMVYRTPYTWYCDTPTHAISNTLSTGYWTPYPWYSEPPIRGILNPLPMVYRASIHGILNPYRSYFDPPTHGILTQLLMVVRIPYPWYFEPPTHGILTLSLDCWPPYPWYIEPYIHGISNLLSTHVILTRSHRILNPISSRKASVTGDIQSHVSVTWLSLHFWWKMTFNPSVKIRQFTINAYAWKQLQYSEDVYE